MTDERPDLEQVIADWREQATILSGHGHKATLDTVVENGADRGISGTVFRGVARCVKRGGCRSSALRAGYGYRVLSIEWLEVVDTNPISPDKAARIDRLCEVCDVTDHLELIVMVQYSPSLSPTVFAESGVRHV